jgi:hypothetical protein
MGLDSLMSLGGSVAQEGKSVLGGFPGFTNESVISYLSAPNACNGY